MPVSSFRAFRYQDPAPQLDPGVMDLSTVLTPLSAVDAPDPAFDDEGFAATHLVRARRQGQDQVTSLWDEWRARGVIGQDTQPAAYLYRSGWKDSGVSRMGSGLILLDRASSLIGPSLVPDVIDVPAEELQPLMVPPGLPLARGTDSNGVHHRLWALEQTAVVEAIVSIVDRALDRTRQITDVPPGLIAATTDGCAPPLGLVFYW